MRNVYLCACAGRVEMRTRIEFANCCNWPTLKRRTFLAACSLKTWLSLPLKSSNQREWLHVHCRMLYYIIFCPVIYWRDESETECCPVTCFSSISLFLKRQLSLSFQLTSNWMNGTIYKTYTRYMASIHCKWRHHNHNLRNNNPVLAPSYEKVWKAADWLISVAILSVNDLQGWEMSRLSWLSYSVPVYSVWCNMMNERLTSLLTDWLESFTASCNTLKCLSILVTLYLYDTYRVTCNV